MNAQASHRGTTMTFQRETQIGLYEPRGESRATPAAAWFWDTAALVSILGCIPLAMATLSIWLDIH